MKRLLSLIMVIMMALPIFASCSKKGGNKTTTTSSSETTTSSQVDDTTTSNTSATKPSSANPTTTVTTNNSVNTNNSQATINSTPTSNQTNTSSPVVSNPEVSTPTTSSNATSSSSDDSIGGGSLVTATGFNYEDYRIVDSSYNRNLFYYNELKFEVADPTVIYIEDENSPEYGYFYAYGTSDQIGCHGLQGWRSKDLTNWEDMGPVYLPDFNNNWAYTNYWAPEIVYDKTGMEINGETYNYFMFYNAETYDPTLDFVGAERGGTTYQAISVLYAKEPNGPFYHPDNVTNQDGKLLTLNKPAYDFTFSNSQIASDVQCEWVIDASPFIDDDGTKYMYYSGSGSTKEGSAQQCVYGVKMKDWLTPDYSTVNILCQTHRMTVGGDLINHEGRQSGQWVNEGPFMIKRNGTYMMTFSVYGYTEPQYQVRLATSTSPLKDFTKIDPYNGGTVIKTVSEWDGQVISAGHHSFIEVGDEVFIAYHTFKNRQNVAQGRALAIDKVEFVNFGGKEIMFTNGPTYGYQPLPVEVSGYKNIANEATVTADGLISGDKAYLTDGLIQHHAANEIGDIGKEVEFNGNSNKITLEFSTYKNIRAIMVNLGRKWAYALGKIKKVTLTYLSDSGDKQVVVDDMQFDYNKFVSDAKKRVYPGGAAILEFADLPIKKIEIELSGVDGYDFMITEVQVLANTRNTTITPVTDAKLAEKYSYTNAPVPAAIKRISGETFGSATAGGVDFHTNYGYDLSNDTIATKSVKTMGPRDQYAYFKNYSQDVVYFEGKLNVYASESYMGDKYPKLGLIAKNSEACTFFYIDGANNYSNMMVGYTQSKIGGGDWDWGATEITKNAPGIIYKGTNNGEANYVKLGMARIDGDFYFFLNDILYFSSPEQRGMPDDREAVYGFLCFNTGMEVKDYSILTDREEVQDKVDLLKQNKQEEQINGAAFGSIDGNELVTTGTTWDLTMDYTPDYHQYDARQVSLLSSDGQDNHLFFINESATTLYLEAEFETTGIIANDDYAKFGVMFKNAEDTGIYFYVDAHTGVKQTTSNLADIVGTSVGYVQKVSGAYQWPGVETANKYNPTQKIKLGVYRQGNYYKVLVNDELLYTTTCSIGGAIYPAIFSFNVGLVVTNYSITSDPDNQMIKDLFIKTSTDDGSVTGLTFGDANDSMKQVGTWVNGIGSGSSSGTGEAVTWASGIGGSNFYFEADIKAGTPINGDQWPKVGIVVRDASTEVFFVIDAINTGNYGANNWVGYGIRQTNGLSVGEWDFSCQFVQVPGMLYTGGASTKMGIWFNNGKIYMTANGRVVLKVADVPGLDSSETLNANVGIMGWGMTFSFENAIAKADATALAAMSDSLGITDSANGITIDGSAADWTGTKASYYSAYGDDATRGFKVSAYKGATGVYALIEGVSSSFVTDYTESGWWWRTNTEMVFFNTNNTQTQVYVAANGECSNAWLFYINNVKRADNLYDVTIELFVPYSSIGYTGEEDYVAGFFAFRPGNEENTNVNTNNENPVWWFGTVHPYGGQSYASATTTYKITADGLVGTGITTVS